MELAESRIEGGISVERLTKRQDDGWAVMDCQICPVSWMNKTGSSCSALYCRNRLKDRVADYEDIGLEPKEIERIVDEYGHCHTLRTSSAERLEIIRKIPTERLRELVEADKDGRCFITPAKIGDTVYHITTCKYFPRVLDGTMYDADGGHGTATGLYCPCELMENCPFPCDDDGVFDCDKHKNTLAIFKDIVDSIHIEDMEDYINFDYSGCADFEDFGKTVFLTCEEAEDALEEIKNG